jgi:hypothetical protein
VSGDAFDHSGKGALSGSGSFRLLCPLGPCRVVNSP